ncbi:MAG: UV DNA damage repair endonuclease UvsE [Clostridiales bacterium]|nr:UV DNA damage repair endonuclease UvsE [Clostridiales bacterium]
MNIRFGYVAMSMNLENCSPSKTATVSVLDKLDDHKNKINRLKHIARENLKNTLRILKYNKAKDIYVYRMSSKIFPLATYPGLEYTNYIEELEPELKELGDFIKENKMRVSSHPDHFVLLNSISKKVYEDSVKDLMYHLGMFEAMGLDENYKFVLHVGGMYKNKQDSILRFYEGFEKLEDRLKKRIILENDDKSFNAEDVLNICRKVKIPMVLDVHHNNCNKCDIQLKDLLNKAFDTWNDEKMVPKIHYSSPKDSKNFRNHANYIDIKEFKDFLEVAKLVNRDFDIMLEAKEKDNALLEIRKWLNDKV